MTVYDDSSFEFIIPTEDGRRFGIVHYDQRRNRGATEIAQWDEARKSWSEMLMRLGRMARIKNQLFDLRWDTASCLGAHPVAGGFSFDFMVPFWDEPSDV